MPTVSVVIPTYNRAVFLGHAIHSALEQQAVDVEVIVADDGSTDDTPRVIRSLGERVVFLPGPHSGRPAVPRNRGIAAARGELLAFLDSDDLFLAGKLARQCDALLAQPGAGLAYADGAFFRTDPRHVIGHALDGMATPSGDGFADLLRGNFLFPATVLVRRSSVERVGGFDEAPDLVGVEDYDLWLRIAAHRSVVHVPTTVAAIRRHDGCLSRDAGAICAGVLRVLDKIERQFPERCCGARTALHEGRARIHAALAVALLRRSRLGSGFKHGMRALGHGLQTPYAGVPAFVDWWRRRYKRRGAQP